MRAYIYVIRLILKEMVSEPSTLYISGQHGAQPAFDSLPHLAQMRY